MAAVAAAGAVGAAVGVWHLPTRMYTDETARAALQGGLLTVAAALTAVAGGLVALDETRQANAETRRANESADSRERSADANAHVRELYVAAIGMLGADSVDVRLGGIYALERVAGDSPTDQRTIVEVLSAFVREHARPQSTGDRGVQTQPGRRWGRVLARSSTQPRGPSDAPATDVQAAAAVLGRLPNRDGMFRADLAQADLRHAELEGVDLGGARMHGIMLRGAHLDSANLAGAMLYRADLAQAQLNNANLTRANLNDAKLTETWLIRADFTGAMVKSAEFARARLWNADLSGNAV